MGAPVNQSVKSYPELIQAVLAQDDDRAFEELVEQSYRLVRKVAAPIVPEWAVDDAVQETYILVYQKLHHLRDPESFPSWLSRIALNVCYKWQNKKQVTTEVQAEHAVSEPHESPLDIKAALATLSGKERNVLILREYIGLSYDEIAQAVDVPIGTVRSRLSKARDRVRKFFADVGVSPI